MIRLVPSTKVEASDEDLYAAWERGDDGAADRLLGRHLQAVGRFFANKVRDPSDAEDQTCKVFEVVTRRLGTFERRSSFRSYLFGIAHNVLRDYVKAVSRRPDDIDFTESAVRDFAPSPSSIIGRRQEEQLLLVALRAIPLQCQIVLELSFFEGMTQAEIAAILSLPPGTVATRIRRGKQLLDEQMHALAASPNVLTSTMQALQDWADGLRLQLADVEGASSSGRNP